jgi:hypothetical protein
VTSRQLRLGLLAVGGVAALVVLWLIRPLVHWPVMLLYQYPLLTWIPVLLGVLAGVGLAQGLRLAGWKDRRRRTWGTRVGWAVGLLSFVLFFVMLPSWQGRSLYEHTPYEEGASLPATTQPRLLPKAAAERYGDREDLKQAHLAVDPETNDLVWTAEKAPGWIPRGRSQGIAMMNLDALEGTARQFPGEAFDPAVSRIGPGSIRWNAYERHYFTRMRDPVIVPLPNGEVVAIAPYTGYKGFPVRRPYWKGVYVYHQDGRMEDLTPQQALARPELVRSGRLFPEEQARDLAEAYGYKKGAGAVLSDDSRTQIDDPEGNPQPYLTNLGDGRIKWVTVGHPPDDDKTINAVFLTDAASGETQVWKPPPGTKLLSNQGAAKLARGLDREWDRRVCCDSDGDSYTDWVRRVVEPRPVFSRGRFYYLVSIEPNPDYLNTREPIESTVLVDAQTRRIVRIFDHDDPEADDALRKVFPPRR